MPKQLQHEQEDSHYLIYNVIKERVRDQFESIDSLDTKAGAVLALIGVFVVDLLGVKWFIELDPRYLTPVILGLFFTTTFALLAVLAKSYRKDPDPKALIDKYKNKDRKDVLGQLIRNMEVSYTDNEKRVKIKATFFNLALLGIFTATILILVAAFLQKNSTIIKHMD